MEWDSKAKNGAGMCVLKTNDDCNGKPLITQYGVCYSCDTTVDVVVGSELAYRCEASCPGKRYYYGGWCIKNK